MESLGLNVAEHDSISRLIAARMAVEALLVALSLVLGWGASERYRLINEKDFRADMADNRLREAASLMLPPDLTSQQGALFEQSGFMKKIGLLPPDAEWRMIGERIDTTLLPELVREGGRWSAPPFDSAHDRFYLNARRRS